MATHAPPRATRARAAHSKPRESVPVCASRVSSEGVCVSRVNGADGPGPKSTGDGGTLVVGAGWEPGGKGGGTAPEPGTLVEELVVAAGGAVVTGSVVGRVVATGIVVGRAGGRVVGSRVLQGRVVVVTDPGAVVVVVGGGTVVGAPELHGRVVVVAVAPGGTVVGTSPDRPTVVVGASPGGT